MIESIKNRLYHCPSPIIGLTGGIASGKSSASKLFTEHGIGVIDADGLVKEIYQEKESFLFIKKNFPTAIIDGKINFPALRDIFFHDLNAKKDIEKFIYQKLPNMFMRHFEKLTRPRFIIYDVPLLFEQQLTPYFDLTILVYATKEQQIERLQKRDQISLSLIHKILESQMSIDQKRELSDAIIENTKGLDYLKEQVDAIIHRFEVLF